MWTWHGPSLFTTTEDGFLTVPVSPNWQEISHTFLAWNDPIEMVLEGGVLIGLDLGSTQLSSPVTIEFDNVRIDWWEPGAPAPAAAAMMAASSETTASTSSGYDLVTVVVGHADDTNAQAAGRHPDRPATAPPVVVTTVPATTVAPTTTPSTPLPTKQVVPVIETVLPRASATVVAHTEAHVEESEDAEVVSDSVREGEEAVETDVPENDDADKAEMATDASEEGEDTESVTDDPQEDDADEPAGEDHPADAEEVEDQEGDEQTAENVEEDDFDDHEGDGEDRVLADAPETLPVHDSPSDHRDHRGHLDSIALDLQIQRAAELSSQQHSHLAPWAVVLIVVGAVMVALVAVVLVVYLQRKQRAKRDSELYRQMIVQ